MKVLTVLENDVLADTITMSIQLRWRGTVVHRVLRGSEAVTQIRLHAPDIVLIQLDLPDADGLDVLREIRQEKGSSRVPVIVISKYDNEVTREDCLDAGADGVIAMPFDHTVLLAMMRSLLRRAGSKVRNAVEAIHLDEYVIDLDGRRLARNGKDIVLTPREWEFLATLAENQGRIVTHRTLVQKVWGSEELSPSSIKMCVHRLREKMGDNPRKPRYLMSHRGVGYSLASR